MGRKLSFGIRLFCSLSSGVYFFMKLLPQRKKVIFLSRQGNTPSIDFKLLRDEMEKLQPDYKFVMKCRSVAESSSAMLRYVPAMLGQMFHIATARLVILDSYSFPISILTHKPGLIVVQLWHALGIMKKYGFSVIDTVEGRNKEVAELLHMHRGYTHILASSPACVSATLVAFGYAPDACSDNRKTLQGVLIGALPRVDYLLDREARDITRAKIYETYSQLKERKVILYAPTFRRSGDAVRRCTEQLIEAVLEANSRGGNFALVIKRHFLQDRLEKSLGLQPLGTSFGRESYIQERCILYDCTFSAARLAMIAEACITDYSASAYEFMMLEKPTYFYSLDLE